MKTKILVSSLLVTALLAGCSNEEYLGSNDDANKLKRPMIDFAFGVDNATTRMTGGSGIAFDGSDKVGAVLVDYDYIIRLAIILYMKDMLVIIDSHGMVLLESLRQMVPW